jgi:hypothetical protein
VELRDRAPGDKGEGCEVVEFSGAYEEFLERGDKQRASA